MGPCCFIPSWPIHVPVSCQIDNVQALFPPAATRKQEQNKHLWLPLVLSNKSRALCSGRKLKAQHMDSLGLWIQAGWLTLILPQGRAQDIHREQYRDNLETIWSRRQDTLWTYEFRDRLRSQQLHKTLYKDQPYSDMFFWWHFILHYTWYILSPPLCNKL